jgi:hypothetical protein
MHGLNILFGHIYIKEIHLNLHNVIPIHIYLGQIYQVLIFLSTIPQAADPSNYVVNINYVWRGHLIPQHHQILTIVEKDNRAAI